MMPVPEDGPVSREERKRREALYAALVEKNKRVATALILKTLHELPSDTARQEAMAPVHDAFCPHCWRKTPDGLRCHCWNDE